MKLYDDYDLEYAVSGVRRGEDYVRRLRDEECHDVSTFIIFMFSNDREINEWTLYYLPLLKKRHRVSEFLIVSPYDGLREAAADHCRCGFRFMVCSLQEMQDVCRYYATYREYDQTYSRNEKIILNGSPYHDDNKVLDIIGYNGITKKEYVAFAIFRYEEIPEDDEVAEALLEEFKYKRIDWNANPCLTSLNDPGFPHMLSKAVDELILNRKISPWDKVILFSFTKSTRYLVKKLKEYNIVAILDNDALLSGTEYKGIRICLPNEFLPGEHDEKYRIIVPTRSYKIICEQLNHLGYELNKQVFVVYTDTSCRTKYDIDEVVKDIRNGSRIYDRIRMRHTNEMLYIVPYPGTGDMYLMGMYLRERMRYDGEDRGVIVVSSRSCEKVYSLIKNDTNISEIVTLDSRKEAVQLLQFARQVGYGKTRVAMLNDSFDLIDIGKLRGYKNLDFNTLFQKIVFHARKKRRGVELISREAERIYATNGLREGMTVILSPYTKSMKAIPMFFWERLAIGLKEAGYDVVTNVAGDEKAVSGTEGITIPYEELLDFVNRSRAFIGIRSGLCDVISGSKTRKVILYHPHIEPNTSSSIGFFGLGNMGIGREPLYELVTDGEDAEIISKIAGIIDE